MQWKWVEDSDEVFSASNALKCVLTAMFDSGINANGVFDRVSEEKFQDIVYHDSWITGAQLMFSLSKKYCLFVHKRYGSLVEGRLFDTEGNVQMILSAGNRRVPKSYGCSRDCDNAALVKSLSCILVVPGPGQSQSTPHCCYCDDKLEGWLNVTAGCRG
jgi:hypothetical protein